MRTHIGYHRLGARRGRKRVYLESRAVAEAGFSPGDRFAVTVDEQCGIITIALDERGSRSVSRRVRPGTVLPVIDVSSDAVDDIARTWERARVEFGAQKIVLRVHRDHAAEAERLTALRDRLTSGAALRVASLCTGIGALDHAVLSGLADVAVPAQVDFVTEIDERVLEAAAANNEMIAPDATIIAGGIQDLEPDLLPKADVLIAGLPCTGASLAGRAARHGDDPEAHPDAGTLFMHFLAAIAKTNPAVVVLENVVPYAKTAGMLAIRALLELRGYTLHETVLDGTSFGDLEDRRRLCLIAVTDGIALDLSAISPVREKPRTLGAVLEAVAMDSPRWKHLAHLDAKNAKAAERGTNFRLQIVDATSEKVPVIGAGYARSRGCEPLIEHPTDQGSRRLLTPREHAAVKGIPFHLVEHLSETQQHQALGNAVTYHAFVAIGRVVGYALRAFSQTDPSAGEQTALFAA